MIQELVASGHSWSDIKYYTLNEIGVFLRAIFKKNARDRAERLSLLWMGSHLEHKDLQETLKKIEQRSGTGTKQTYKKKQPSKEEIANEWRRLAAAMRGVK